jgi:cell division protein FtsB
MNDNDNFENEYMDENDNYGEENMYENEEENEIMDNEEDNELNQILQEMDFVLNSENLEEIMKNFIINIKNKLLSLKEENTFLKVNLINSNEQNNLKINQLKNIINKYKSMQSQKNNFTGSKEDLFELNNKVNKYEFIISRLKMEKKMLESKLDNLKKDYNNEIFLMKNLNNNELQSYQKRINEMIKNENKNNNNLNMSKKMFELKRKQENKFFIDKIKLLQENNEKLSNENINLDEENKEFKTRLQQINLNSKYKDQIIKSLKEKIQSIPNDYKDSLNSLVKSNEQSRFQINQLFKENDKLRQENQMLTIEMNKLRDNLGNNSLIKNFKDKLNKYRVNIIVLKKRINELLEKKENNIRINSDYKNLMKYKSSMNFFRP